MIKPLHAVGLGTVLGMFSAGLWLGCSSDNSTPNNTDAGGTSSSSSSSSGASSGGKSSSSSSSSSGASSSSGSGSGSSSGASSSSSSSSGGSTSSSSSGGSSSGSSGGDAGDAGATADCAGYCAIMMSACTGANAQYQTLAECLTACPYIPAGDASTGNTFACHFTHANLAITLPNPHCWHAGPYGYGVCGDNCGDFCTIAASYCTPDGGFAADSGTPPYTSESACATTCAGFTPVSDAGTPGAEGGFYALGPGTGNTLDCREYHLGNALTTSANQQVHCNHVGMVSPVCK